MKVFPEVRCLAKYKEKKKEFSVATLQFDVTFCTLIPCAPSVHFQVKSSDVKLRVSNLKGRLLKERICSHWELKIRVSNLKGRLLKERICPHWELILSFKRSPIYEKGCN